MPARLKKARTEGSQTRMALGHSAQVSDAIIRYIETNERLPTLATVARIASALSVSAGWLVYGLGDRHTNGPTAATNGIGARLQAVRVEQGHTKAELGRLAKLTAPTITKIENGGSSGVQIVEALADALNVSPAWLAFGDGPRELPKKRRASKSQETTHS